jgi:hypothetical protein
MYLHLECHHILDYFVVASRTMLWGHLLYMEFNRYENNIEMLIQYFVLQFDIVKNITCLLNPCKLNNHKNQRNDNMYIRQDNPTTMKTVENILCLVLIVISNQFCKLGLIVMKLLPYVCKHYFTNFATLINEPSCSRRRIYCPYSILSPNCIRWPYILRALLLIDIYIARGK